MRILWTLILISCILLITEAVPATPETELKLQFHRKRDVDFDISKSTFGENTFAYVTEKRDHDETKPTSYVHRDYIAVLTTFDIKGVTSNKTCNVDFTAVEPEFFFDTMIYSLHKDIIVFALVSGKFEEGSRDMKYTDVHHNYRFLHMGTCKYYDAKVEINLHGMAPSVINFEKINILRHDDGTFDIFVPTGPCDGARCKYSFNDKAEKLSGPVPFMSAQYRSNVLKIYPSTKSTTSNNYFVFISGWKVRAEIPYDDIEAEFLGPQRLVFVKGNEITELAHFDYDYHKEKLLVKNSNGYLSLCRQYKFDGKDEINCMQFSDDVMKFNHTVVVSDSEKLLAVYNVPFKAPNDGAFVVKGNCVAKSCNGVTFEAWSEGGKVDKAHWDEDFKYEMPVFNAIVSIADNYTLCYSVYYHSNYSFYDFAKKCFRKNPSFDQ